MHVKSLKIFCDVVTRRSFSRAAEENGISQSSASQVVHQLEQRLDTQLIDRSKRPFVMTPQGKAFYDGCRVLVQSYFQLEEEVRWLHQEVSGRVVVASIYSVGLSHMNRYLQQFLSAHPKANVRLQYLHSRQVYEAVENDKSDLGLISYPKSSRALEVIPWRSEPMVLVCSPEDELASARAVRFGDLHGRSLVQFDHGLSIRKEIDRELQSHGVEVRVAMEFDNIETIKRAIEIGAGLGFLPEPTVAREVATGALVKIPIAENTLVRPLAILHRRGKRLSGTARRFIELLTSQPPEDQISARLHENATTNPHPKPKPRSQKVPTSNEYDSGKPNGSAATEPRPIRAAQPVDGTTPINSPRADSNTIG